MRQGLCFAVQQKALAGGPSGTRPLRELSVRGEFRLRFWSVVWPMVEPRVADLASLPLILPAAR